MKCEKCGTALNPTDIFCGTCGSPAPKPVSQVAPLVNPTIEPVFAAPVLETPSVEPVVVSIEPAIEVFDVNVQQPEMVAAVEPVISTPIVEPVQPVIPTPVVTPIVEPTITPVVEPVIAPTMEPIQPTIAPTVGPVLEPIQPTVDGSNSKPKFNIKMLLIIGGILLGVAALVAAAIMFLPDLLKPAKIEKYSADGYYFKYDENKWNEESGKLSLIGYETDEAYITFSELVRFSEYDLKLEDDRDKFIEDFDINMNDVAEISDVDIVNITDGYVDFGDKLHYHCYDAEYLEEKKDAYAILCLVVDSKYNQGLEVTLNYTSDVKDKKIKDNFMEILKSIRVTEDVAEEYDDEYEDDFNEYVTIYTPYDWDYSSELSTDAYEVHVYSDNFTKVYVTALADDDTNTYTIEGLLEQAAEEYSSQNFISKEYDVEFDDGEDIVWVKATSEDYLDSEDGHSYHDILYIGQMMDDFEEVNISYIIAFKISNSLTEQEMIEVNNDMLEIMEDLYIW